jgi:hypothetical protein
MNERDFADLPVLVSIDDAARIFGYTRGGLYNLIKSARWPKEVPLIQANGKRLRKTDLLRIVSGELRITDTRGRKPGTTIKKEVL